MSDIPELSDEKVAAFRNSIDQALTMLREFPFEAWKSVSRQKKIEDDREQAVKIMHGCADAMKSCADDLEASVKTLHETIELLGSLSKAAAYFNSEWARIKKIAESPEFKTLKDISEMQRSGFLERMCKIANEIPGTERGS